MNAMFSYKQNMFIHYQLPEKAVCQLIVPFSASYRINYVLIGIIISFHFETYQEKIFNFFPDDIMQRCPTCQKLFSRKPNLLRHSLMKHPESPDLASISFTIMESLYFNAFRSNNLLTLFREQTFAISLKAKSFLIFYDW